jgi:hypothetical protein
MYGSVQGIMNIAELPHTTFLCFALGSSTSSDYEATRPLPVVKMDVARAEGRKLEEGRRRNQDVYHDVDAQSTVL